MSELDRKPKGMKKILNRGRKGREGLGEGWRRVRRSGVEVRSAVNWIGTEGDEKTFEQKPAKVTKVWELSAG